MGRHATYRRRQDERVRMEEQMRLQRRLHAQLQAALVENWQAQQRHTLVSAALADAAAEGVRMVDLQTH